MGRHYLGCWSGIWWHVQRRPQGWARLGLSAEYMDGDPDDIARLPAPESNTREITIPLAMLTALVDWDLCSADEQGNCETHGLTSMPCAVAEARKLLPAYPQLTGKEQHEA